MPPTSVSFPVTHCFAPHMPGTIAVSWFHLGIVSWGSPHPEEQRSWTDLSFHSHTSHGPEAQATRLQKVPALKLAEHRGAPQRSLAMWMSLMSPRLLWGCDLEPQPSPACPSVCPRAWPWGPACMSWTQQWLPALRGQERPPPCVKRC